jgi:hypothetical protein
MPKQMSNLELLKLPFSGVITLTGGCLDNDL